MLCSLRRFLTGIAIALLAVLAAASLATTGAAAAPKPSPSATPTPSPSGSPSPSGPPTPTVDPAAVAAAQKRAEAASQQVDALNARIAQQTKQVHALASTADRARARYSSQLLARKQAAKDAQDATAARGLAQLEYDRAHRRFVEMIRGSVVEMANPMADTAYAVLTADSPNAVLDALQLGQIAEQNQVGVVDDMTQALARRTAAEHAQRDALARQTRLAGELAKDANAANAALAAARQGLEVLRQEIGQAKQSQAAAIVALSQFLGGWSVADPTQAAALNEQYRQIAIRAAAVPKPKNPGHWTPQIGRYVANRALEWIGTPYAWAGGNAAGPTQGVCAGGDAAQDCHVVGFDCSGLALYGWAPYVSMPHLASTQYVVAGSQHPAITALLPGDLVFWSDNGAASGIHHVAVYVGDGNVVQAPQSGDIVRVTPLANVDAGYFGATRPMS